MSIKSSLGRQLGTQFDTVFDVVKSNPIYDKAGGSIPSLDLNFAKSKSLLDARSTKNKITFTRASSGTYVGSDGLIKTAVTNLWQWSNSAVNGETWNNVGVYLDLTSGQADPVGGTTAIRASDANNNTGGTPLQRTNLASLTTGATISYSIWLKPISCPNNILSLLVYANGTTDYISSVFTVSGEQITGITATTTGGTGVFIDSSVTPYPNGWYRCVLTGIPSTVTMTDVRTRVNLGSYQRVQGTARFDWYGAQLEQSSTVGEYIPTTSTINSAPRFDHDPTTGESLGLLVEESRTNLLPYSEDLTSPNYFLRAVTTSFDPSSVNPTGSLGSYKILADSGLGNGGVRINKSLNSANNIVVSAFVKKSTHRYALVGFGGIGNSFTALFDIEPGLTSNRLLGQGGKGTFTNIDAGYQNLPNDWIRIWAAGTTTGIDGATVGMSPDATTFNITNWTAAGTEEIYAWGLQYEDDTSFPTSYIPTEGSTVTRAADVASISGSNFSSWYRQDEGSAFVDFTMNGVNVGNNFIYDFSNGTGDEEIFLNYKDTGNARWAARIASVQATQDQNGAGLSRVKHAFAMASNNYMVARDSILSTGSSLVGMPSNTSLRLGARFNNTSTSNGTIRRFTYWPTRLPDSTLQTITQ
jgi:hypothetical protein